MSILTLFIIAAGILVFTVAIIRIASLNSGKRSYRRFNFRNSDPALLNFNLGISDVAKENKHQNQTRKAAEEFQKRAEESQKQAADAAERERDNFEVRIERNEKIRKQIRETNKGYSTMWG